MPDIAPTKPRTWVAHRAPEAPPDREERHIYYEHTPDILPERGRQLGIVVPIQRHWGATAGRLSAPATTLAAGKALVEQYADEGNAPAAPANAPTDNAPTDNAPKGAA